MRILKVYVAHWPAQADELISSGVLLAALASLPHRNCKRNLILCLCSSQHHMDILDIMVIPLSLLPAPLYCCKPGKNRKSKQ